MGKERLHDWDSPAPGGMARTGRRLPILTRPPRPRAAGWCTNRGWQDIELNSDHDVCEHIKAQFVDLRSTCARAAGIAAIPHRSSFPVGAPHAE